MLFFGGGCRDSCSLPFSRRPRSSRPKPRSQGRQKPSRREPRASASDAADVYIANALPSEDPEALAAVVARHGAPDPATGLWASDTAEAHGMAGKEFR